MPTGIEKYYLKMKNPIITRLGKSLAGATLAALAILVISSCGGGDGDDAASRNVIAPESLDEVKINFFDAFTIDCYRLNGTAGNESGAGDYDRLKIAFNYQNPDGVGYPASLPLSISNLSYQYQRTGVDTGRIEFTYKAIDERFPDLAPESGFPAGNMFWGDSKTKPTKLIVDVLFTAQGAVIGNTASRIQYIYKTSPEIEVKQFDASNVRFSKLDGQPVPTAYNPYTTLTDKTPSAVVMTSLGSKDFDFLGDFLGKIAFRKTGVTGPDLPGDVRAEESGTILITEMPAQTVGYNGTYSYARTGGAYAKLAVEYLKKEGGIETTLRENFVLEFKSLDDGSYTTTSGGIGTFQNDLFSPGG